jgi:3-methylcrotonyl-CoA carboxylase alpha subunit
VHARVADAEYTATAREHHVQVRDPDGMDATFETQYLGHGRLVLRADGRRRLAWVVEDHERRWVFCDGAVTVVDMVEGVAKPRPRRAGDGHDTLTAPMPATVIRVVAPAGSLVERGATVLLLEAMKMELPLRAPHRALVSAVHCREGEIVQPDATLVELHDVPDEGGT